MGKFIFNAVYFFEGLKFYILFFAQLRVDNKWIHFSLETKLHFYLFLLGFYPSILPVMQHLVCAKDAI